MIIVFINMFLNSIGVELIPYTNTQVGGIVEAVLSIASILASWWYNNSFSKKAKTADEVFNALNSGDEIDISRDGYNISVTKG